MPDYSNGKIYTIRNRNDNTKIYVGSTIQLLHKRFHSHKCKSQKEEHKNNKLYIEMNNDLSNWYIELYENYPCNNREELNKREGEIIREIGTLNTNIAGRDEYQYRIDTIDKSKQYRIDHANKIKEQKKQYYIDNIDKFKEKRKQYYIDNADKLKENSKQYYLNKKTNLIL